MVLLEENKVVEVKELCKVYYIGETTTRALDNISFPVEKGEFLIVLGPSGSGKTTLLNMISALDVPTSGSVFVDGEDISALPDKDRTTFRAQKIGLVFQFFNLFPALTARENVEIGLALTIKGREEIEKRARKYLEMVGLGEHMDKYPSQLSGGEQQRVAVARALAKEPKLLLADEPTGNLDYETGSTVWELLQKLNRETRTTVISVTHEASVAEIADRTIYLRSGRVERIVSRE